jgi:hypothetical protein
LYRQNKTARTDSQERTARTGQPGLDYHDGTTRKVQPEQYRPERISGLQDRTEGYPSSRTVGIKSIKLETSDMDIGLFVIG